MGKNRTPQDNSFNCAKIYSRAETILYTVSFLFSIFQHFTSCMPENYFLIITGLILIFLLCLKRLKVRSLDKANDGQMMRVEISFLIMHLIIIEFHMKIKPTMTMKTCQEA